MTWEDVIKWDYARGVIDFDQFEDEMSALLERDHLPDRIVGGLPVPQAVAR